MLKHEKAALMSIEPGVDDFNTTGSEYRGYWMTLNHLTNGSHVKAEGFQGEVLIHNEAVEIRKRTDEVLEDDSISFYGFSPTMASYNRTIECVQKIKRRRPEVIVALGGSHVSKIPLNVMRNQRDVDYVVRGDYGELALKALLENKPPQEIPFLVYRDGTQIMFDEKLTDYFEPRATLTEVDYSLLNSLEPYFNNYKKANPDSPFGKPFTFLTQRGCAWSARVKHPGVDTQGCSFCSRQDENLRMDDPKLVWERIRRLHEEFGCDGILMPESDALNIPGKDTFFERFYESRPDDMKGKVGIVMLFTKSTNMTPDRARKLKDLGGYEILYGIESFVQEKLKVMKKGTTVEQNFNALNITGNNGLHSFVNLVVGTYGESEATLDEEMRALERVFKIPGIRRL